MPKHTESKRKKQNKTKIYILFLSWFQGKHLGKLSLYDYIKLYYDIKYNVKLEWHNQCVRKNLLRPSD